MVCRNGKDKKAVAFLEAGLRKKSIANCANYFKYNTFLLRIVTEVSLLL